LVILQSIFFSFHLRLSAVISIGECNTSGLIMDEEVLAWQKEEALGCRISRSRSCGGVGKREIA
jgi:hypothetical protein